MKRLHKCTSKTRRKKSKVVEDADRISKLPEPILHQIFSFLSTKDAIRTCVLSKTWNSAFNSFPVLNFDQYDYFRYSDDIGEFYNYVNNSIDRRCQNISIQRFKLDVDIKYQSQLGDVERWLNYAVNKNVEHLDLHYYNELNARGLYRLPTSALFRANSLKELVLVGCKLNVKTGIDHNILGCFSSLKKLTLERSHIDEQILQSLLSSRCSPSLEDVSMTHCIGFRSVSLCSPKLECVDLLFSSDDVVKITIEALNLRVLGLGGEIWANNVLSSSSFKASMYKQNLKKLVLEEVDINKAIFRVIQEFVALEKLELYNCDVLESITISFYQHPNLAAARDTRILLKNGGLVAECRCCYKEEPNHLDRVFVLMRNGLYKLEIK